MISGKKLRLAGKGEPSPFGGPAGDLFIKSKILPDARFEAQGNDLHLAREIKLSEALLGTEIAIPTLTGNQLNLKIPPGTRHNTKMRLAGHGLPIMNKRAQGDLFVQIQVRMPKTLSREQKQLVEQLAALGL